MLFFKNIGLKISAVFLRSLLPVGQKSYSCLFNKKLLRDSQGYQYFYISHARLEHCIGSLTKLIRKGILKSCLYFSYDLIRLGKYIYNRIVECFAVQLVCQIRLEGKLQLIIKYPFSMIFLLPPLSSFVSILVHILVSKICTFEQNPIFNALFMSL